MKKLMLITLAMVFSASGAFAAMKDNTPGNSAARETARGSGELLAGERILAQVMEETTPPEAAAKTPEASVQETPSPEKSAPTESWWQKIKNKLSSSKKPGAPEENAQEATVDQETKAPEAAIPAAPVTPEQSAPQTGDQAAPADQETKAPEALVSEEPSPKSAEATSWWQKVKNIFSPRKDAPVTTPEQSAPQTGDQAAPADQEAKAPDAPVQDALPAEKSANLWQQALALLVSPQLDMRFKFGGAAELNKITLYGSTYSGSGASGNNMQLEAAAGFYGQANRGLVLSAGVFKRQHSGDAVVNSNPTAIDYDATGVSLGAGMGLKANDKLHFEGRLEVDLGTGQPTFSAPGVVWNQSKSGGYGAYALVLGGYYRVTPGLQLGLELGTQSFTGDYSIMNNSGQWIASSVEGNGRTVNALVGYRF